MLMVQVDLKKRMMSLRLWNNCGEAAFGCLKGIEEHDDGNWEIASR